MVRVRDHRQESIRAGRDAGHTGRDAGHAVAGGACNADAFGHSVAERDAFNAAGFGTVCCDCAGRDAAAS